LKSATSLLSLVFVTQINATLPVHEAQHDRAAISVDNPWVRSAPPNAPILGAFMEISNHSDSDIKLLSANTKGYKRLDKLNTKFNVIFFITLSLFILVKFYYIIVINIFFVNALCN
jgi:copper(I)-binding protein